MEESEAFDYVMTNMRDEVYKELYPEIREEVLREIREQVKQRKDNYDLLISKIEKGTQDAAPSPYYARVDELVRFEELLNGKRKNQNRKRSD